jgi:RNA polymerase sigma factor, sigma-70 family
MPEGAVSFVAKPVFGANPPIGGVSRPADAPTHRGGRISDGIARLPGERASNEDLLAFYHTNSRVEVLEEILRRNEGLLHHALKRFSHSGEAYDDLFQVARMGLIKAAQRYDPARANSFVTYAMAIVDGEVRHYLRDCLLVRQPRWARALYQRIQEVQTEFYRTAKRSPTLSELAKAVNLREEGVLEVIRVYGVLNLHSLDEPFDEGSVEPPDRTLMRSVRQETFSLPIEDRIILYDALGVLSDLHKRIVYLLFFRDLTQQEVAQETGLTQRTVSREQSKALARLKAVLGKKLF